MKYDNQITELKNLLPSTKSVLIALPLGADIDKLASGLALYLAMQAQGKEVAIISDDTITVSQSYLFGINRISKNLPLSQGGNLTITLEGVASSNGSIPALEKLDWYAENNNLNLVFHILSGQTFQPTKIVPAYQGSGFNLIFVIGAANLDSLGNIYKQNANAFSGVHIVNIDNQGNTGFGQTNVLDTNASSLSEIMGNLFLDLGLILDPDASSNLLAGIFDATNNLSDPKTSADTYMVVANLLRVGGKKPSLINNSQITPSVGPDLSALIPPDAVTPAGPVAPVEYSVPPVVPTPPADQPSPEERPFQEGVISESIEPEWLTPKIFKGTSIG